mgnify:FL=1
MNLAYKFRLFIVLLGKTIPFILMTLLLLFNIEGLYSYLNDVFIDMGGGCIMLDKSIDWEVSYYISYDWLTMLVLLALSYGLKLCVANKMAVYFLIISLIEKTIIENVNIDISYIPYILIVNIIIISIILGLGVLQFIRNIKKSSL